MKNILLIVICFLGINAYGQFPINQTTGSPTTLVRSRGGQGADSGFVYPTFLDTARMNGGFLKNIAGIMLRQGDTLWLRNKTATRWLPIIAGASGGSGSYVDTIYRKAGQDSIFYTINGGAERSIKDSIGSGGSGSVEYVVSGVSIRVDSSGRTYTVNADTGRGNSQLITGASLNLVADSLGDLIDLKPNVGDVILNQQAKQTGKRFDIQSGKFDSLYASTATGLILVNNSAAEIGRFGGGGGTTVTWQGLNTFSGGATINGTTTIGSLSGILKASTGVVGTAVSGTDLKTINGTSIIGSGDIVTPDNGITALTGDVTASGSGSVAATLATVNGNVGTFKKATVTANGKGLVTAISEGFGLDTVYRKAGQDSIFFTINGGTERAIKDSVGGGGGGTPGGGTYSIQYNRAGAFAGANTLAYDTVRKTLAFNGVTVSPWNTTAFGGSIEGTNTSMNFGQSTDLHINSNAYFEGGNWKYKTTNLAANYYQLTGEHNWRIAASGTAGNTITWNNAMILKSTGRLGIGVTAPAQLLHVRNGNILVENTSTTGASNYLMNNDVGQIGGFSAVGSANAISYLRNNITFGGTNSAFIVGNSLVTNSTSSTTFISIVPGGNNVSNQRVRFYNAGTKFGTAEVSTAPDASALIEMVSTSQGFLRTRQTTGQRDAIASAATGLSIYNTTLSTNDVKTAAAWYQQPNGLTGSATLDFPSTGAHSSSDLTITVTGAAVGDIVIVGTPVQDIDATYTAFVSLANTVTVRFNHYGSGTTNPASGTFKVYVIKN